MKLHFLFGPAFLIAALLWAPLASAQLVIPGFQNEAVAIPADYDAQAHALAALQKAEEDFRRSADRLQEQFRWQMDRLESRRTGLAEQQRAWRTRRTTLGRRSSNPRVEALDDLLVAARSLDRLLRDLQDAYDSHLRALLEAESSARSFQLKLDDGFELAASDLNTQTIDLRLEELEILVQRREQRLNSIDASRDSLERSADEHRDELNAARILSFAIPDEELEAEGPPEKDVAISAAELLAIDELLELRDEGRRIKVSNLEFQGELDRVRLAILKVQAEQTALPQELEEYEHALLTDRRIAVAAREEDGVFNVTTALWDPAALRAGLSHTRELLSSPGRTAAQLVQRAVHAPGRSSDKHSLLLVVALVGLMAGFAGGRVRRWISGLTPRSVSDAIVFRSALSILPVLPLSLVCVLLVGLELVPQPLVPLTRFSAIAPPLAASFLSAGALLFPPGGSSKVSRSVSDYMRRLIRYGAVLACVIGLAAALMPLLGYPAHVNRILKASLAAWLLLGWIGMLLRRKEVLALLGAEGDISHVGILKAGVRRFYRVFMFGPVAVYILYAFGYVNLAQLLVRGGLVTISVLLLAPWIHDKLRAAIARGLGYPDGGGLLALTAEGSRTAFRSVAPLLLLAVGAASLGLVASGWDYGGNLFSNLVGAMTFPLLDVGGSQISALSLVLLAFTIALTFLGTRWVVQLLNANLYPLYDLDRATKTTLDALVRYVLVGLGLVVSLDVVGVGVGILTVFAGVIGIGLGFGSQTLVANFMAGLILLMTRRVTVEDVIEVEGRVGRVRRISSFSTVVVTLDNLEVVVPNSKIMESSVTNWSRGDSPVRLNVAVEVAYGSDVALVRRLLMQVAQEDPRVLENPAPLVRFDEFGASGLLFILAPWIENAEERLMVSSDLRFRIDRVFREHDVEIPFAQQDVHIRAGDGTIRVAFEDPPRASEGGELDGGEKNPSGS